MEIEAALGFVIIISLLVFGLAGMFVLGRPRRRKRWPTDVGQGGDGGAWPSGGEGGSGADFGGHASHGGGGDAGGHGGH